MRRLESYTLSIGQNVFEIRDLRLSPQEINLNNLSKIVSETGKLGYSEAPAFCRVVKNELSDERNVLSVVMVVEALHTGVDLIHTYYGTFDADLATRFNDFRKKIPQITIQLLGEINFVEAETKNLGRLIFTSHKIEMLNRSLEK